MSCDCGSGKTVLGRCRFCGLTVCEDCRPRHEDEFIKTLKTSRTKSPRFTTLKLERLLTRGWMYFGVTVFLTSTIMTFFTDSVLADLASIVYFAAYCVSWVLFALSIFLLLRRRKPELSQSLGDGEAHPTLASARSG